MKKLAKTILIIIIILIVLIGGVAMFMFNKDKKDKIIDENNTTIRKFNSYIQFSCNIYVISSNKGNILIDSGHYSREIKNYIEEIGGLDAILLTHGHWDHTYGLDSLKSDYPDVPVYIPKDGYDFLTDPYLNGSSMNGFSEYVQSEVNTISGDELNIGDYTIEVIDMPGHCRGCVTYYFKDENILFTGDSVLKDTRVPIRATGSEEDKMNSIRKFINLGYKDETKVYPGHGESTTYGYLLENNPDIREVK